MMDVHGFREQLDWSHRMHRLPIWQSVYSRAFPGAISVLHEADGEHQRAGIDRSLILPNSKQILIDEKARKPRPMGWYSGPVDVLLEYESNDRTNAPGWVVKALRADFIAYAILQLGKCYLLPVIQLQQAWLKNSALWLRKYGTKPAPNSTYNTLNCPVPVDVLFGAIGSCLRYECDPMSWEQLQLFMQAAAA